MKGLVGHLLLQVLRASPLRMVTTIVRVREALDQLLILKGFESNEQIGYGFLCWETLTLEWGQETDRNAERGIHQELAHPYFQRPLVVQVSLTINIPNTEKDTGRGLVG